MAEENGNTIRVLLVGHRSVDMLSLTGETIAEFVHRVSFAPLRPRYMEKQFPLSRTNGRYIIGRLGQGGIAVDEGYVLQPGDVLCGFGRTNDNFRKEFNVTCQEEDIASCRTCNQRKAEVYGEPK